jgi:hypothetical protein
MCTKHSVVKNRAELTVWGQADLPEQYSKKRPKQSKEQNLLDWLEAYDDCILAFLNVPFTNNEGGRDLEHVQSPGQGLRMLWHHGQSLSAMFASALTSQPCASKATPELEYLHRALDGRPFFPRGGKMT